MEHTSEITRGRLLDEQCRYAARALFAAAVMSAIRALLLPWLVAHSPPDTFPGVDADSTRLVGLGQAALFVALACWARKDPLPAAIAALACYLGMAVPDIINNTGFLAQGLISKAVMILILARALLAGVLHRTAYPATSPHQGY
jgi:hypothetical protein